MSETRLLSNTHLLVCIDLQLNDELTRQLEIIKSEFCGMIWSDDEDTSDKLGEYDRGNVPEDSGETVTSLKLQPETQIFLCGNADAYFKKVERSLRRKVFIVKEFSQGYDKYDDLITVGQVPLNVHDVGVLYKDLFGSLGHFETLKSDHQFQTLTESDKPGFSFRKGIYLSDVHQESDSIKFNLLRCSTNLAGPTDNFRAIDRDIIERVNDVAKQCFSEPAKLNHVLAQIYENFSESETNKEKKARIKTHSDKTDDMSENGLIAFCTFYSQDIYSKTQFSKIDSFDRVYKHGSALTKLRFQLKDCVRGDYEKEFNVILYPNSAFLIPLSTNRFYTHSIVPPTLPVAKIPTRLGYVIRCSRTQAVHQGGDTYICKDGHREKLERPTSSEREEIKALYCRQNTTDEPIDYASIKYTLNDGDLLKPKI